MKVELSLLVENLILWSQITRDLHDNINMLCPRCPMCLLNADSPVPIPSLCHAKQEVDYKRILPLAVLPRNNLPTPIPGLREPSRGLSP